MEHRWGRRVAVDVDVRIFADPASAGWGRLRNISISGGFVETTLRIPVLSTLGLTAPATDSRAECLVRAIVVRSTAAGVGVEWCEGDCNAIRTLMHEAGAVRHSPHRVSDGLRL